MPFFYLSPTFIPNSRPDLDNIFHHCANSLAFKMAAFMMEVGEILEGTQPDTPKQHVSNVANEEISMDDITDSEQQDTAFNLSMLVIDDSDHQHVTVNRVQAHQGSGDQIQGPRCFAVPRGRFNIGKPKRKQQLANKQDKAGELHQQQQKQKQKDRDHNENHPPRAPTPRALLDSYRPKYDGMAEHDTRPPREDRGGGHGGRGGGGGGGGFNRKRRFNRGELWIYYTDR